MNVLKKIMKDTVVLMNVLEDIMKMLDVGERVALNFDAIEFC